MPTQYYGRQKANMMLRHRQAVEPMPAGIKAQAPTVSMPQAQAIIPQNGSSVSTQVAVAVVVGVIFVICILLLIYRQYMKRLAQEDRRRYRLSRTFLPRQDVLWQGPRRPRERKTGTRGFDVGQLDSTDRRVSYNYVTRGTEEVLTSRVGPRNTLTETSGSSYSSTTMTSSTDVSSTKAILESPAHTMTYPPKAQTKLERYPCCTNGDFPSTSSLVSSYKTEYAGERTQAGEPILWPPDMGVLSEQVQDNRNRYEASGWSMTGSASSTVTSFIDAAQRSEYQETLGGSHGPNSITAHLGQGYRPDRFQNSGDRSTFPVNAPPMPLSDASYNVISDRQGRTRPFQGFLGDSTLISSFHTAHTGLPESLLEHQSPSDRSLSPMGTISSMISSLSREGTIPISARNGQHRR